MEKKDFIPCGDVIDYLKTAALFPQRRAEMIVRALEELLVCLPVAGTALVWPCQDRNTPWKVYYAGERRESMQRWLAARLDVSLDFTLSVLQQDLPKLSDMPAHRLICLQPPPIFPAGLWIVWPLPCATNECLEDVHLALEALIEVQGSEAHYFSSTSPLSDRALIEALGQGDPHALSAFLGFTRLIGNAEFTAWGRAYETVVETTDHLGARQSGFGFAVPRGEGVGGRVAAGIPILNIEDYRNSLYRYPSICEIVDSEHVRSLFALPVRSRTRQEKSGQVVGVLYATRRIIKPFSLAERLLVQRMTRLLEPLSPLTRPSSFLSPGLPTVSDQRTAWYKLLSHANHIADLEAWIGQFITGTIVVTDSDGHPYVSARSEQLEHELASRDQPMAYRLSLWMLLVCLCLVKSIFVVPLLSHLLDGLISLLICSSAAIWSPGGWSRNTIIWHAKGSNGYTLYCGRNYSHRLLRMAIVWVYPLKKVNSW